MDVGISNCASFLEKFELRKIGDNCQMLDTVTQPIENRILMARPGGHSMFESGSQDGSQDQIKIRVIMIPHQSSLRLKVCLENSTSARTPLPEQPGYN